VHVTGDSLNPGRGIEADGGGPVPCPLIAGQVDGDGDGIYGHDGRHVTYMLDADYRVYRLTPDGTYEPVRNLASLHHDADDTMHDRDRPGRHGLARGTRALGGALGRGREIAQECLAMMGLALAEAMRMGLVEEDPESPGGAFIRRGPRSGEALRRIYDGEPPTMESAMAGARAWDEYLDACRASLEAIREAARPRGENTAGSLPARVP